MHIDKLIEVLTKIKEKNPNIEVMIRQNVNHWSGEIKYVEVVHNKIEYYEIDEMQSDKDIQEDGGDISMVNIVFKDHLLLDDDCEEEDQEDDLE